MEWLSEISEPVKPRRRHSPQFKAQVLQETQQYGVSVAAVARRHNLNANLIHKWRQVAKNGGSGVPATPGFISLPAPSMPAAPEPTTSCLPEVRLEVPSAQGIVTLHWPCDQPGSLAALLKSLT